MKMELLSYNSNTFSPNYQAFIIYPKQLRMEALPNILPVAGTWGQYTGKSFGGGFLTIQVKYLTSTPSTQHTYEAEIARWFNTLDVDLYKLIAQDTADSNRQWYVKATPVSVVQENDSAVIVLALEKPYWSVEAASTDTWTITASGQTRNLSSIGEKARPVFTITPNNAKSVSGVWGYSRFVHVTCVTTLTKPYPVNLGPLDTAALVTAGKALATGDDFRVLNNGVEIPRWFGTGAAAFNQTTTKIWISIPDFKSIYMQLETGGIPSTPITEISIKNNRVYRGLMSTMPQKGLLCVRSQSDPNVEYFYYTGIDLVNNKLTGVTRAAKGTTARAHPSGTTCFLVPHDITIIYGNSTAIEPTYDDSQKPIIDLGSSTNTSFVFTEFAEEAKPQRTGSWIKSLISSNLKTSKTYTAADDTTADPAEVMGLKIATGQVNAVEQGESAKLAWMISVAGFLTNISITGQKYRATTDWPNARVESSADSINWNPISTISSPSADSVWEAISVSVSTGGRHQRILMEGSLAAGAGNKAMVELSDVTITLDSNYVPIPYLRAETSAYYLDATITNLTTGQAIRLAYPMKTGNSLVVDCDKKTITYYDGSNALNALTLNDERTDWMTFAYGVNQLEFIETGVTNLTIATSWVAENPV